jgi:predicted RNA-binding Zn-ribbon protein involved in translation (DUF1610 family)
VTYKAGLSGVAVIAVDPRNTSRCCPQCGFTDKANRKTQETFSCTSCGYTAAADFAAARNIRAARAALVTQPHLLHASASGKSPRIYAWDWLQCLLSVPRPVLEIAAKTSFAGHVNVASSENLSGYRYLGARSGAVKRAAKFVPTPLAGRTDPASP